MSRGTVLRSAELDRAYLQIHHPGISATEAAAALNVTRRTITRVRARLNLSQPSPHTTRRYTPDDLARIAARLDDGWSFREIERTEKTTWRTIARHFPGRSWTREQIGAHAATLARHR